MAKSPIPAPGGILRTLNIRDNIRRQIAAQAEPERRALKYVAYNTSLPVRTRLQAQLKLTAMPSNTRITLPKNRCILSGKGRSIVSDFKMCRYQFRMNAIAGVLPGVKRATW
ncbi:glucocorticoid receptor-like (DNA-binding domain) [Lipomyces arxii]|uniref:mitochondrial 37S ribosomal protein uS14m n=1 Tax=Lipomyces arxii TaxID=56418 RepID=UPI0034CF0B53